VADHQRRLAADRSDVPPGRGARHRCHGHGHPGSAVPHRLLRRGCGGLGARWLFVRQGAVAAQVDRLRYQVTPGDRVLRHQALADEPVLPARDHFRVVDLDEANAVVHGLDALLPIVPVIRPCRGDNKEVLVVESGETTEHAPDLVLADAALDRHEDTAALADLGRFFSASHDQVDAVDVVKATAFQVLFQVVQAKIMDRPDKHRRRVVRCAEDTVAAPLRLLDEFVIEVDADTDALVAEIRRVADADKTAEAQNDAG